MPTDEYTLERVTRALERACRALAQAGNPKRAGELAAEAWAAVRTVDPALAARLDGTMHYTARLEGSAAASRSDDHQEVIMSTDRILDVRSEAPARRHELIFDTFGTITPGEAYVLVNDHDPKPLKYQFEAENAGEFSWEYLEQGPEVWRVRIGRVAAAAS